MSLYVAGFATCPFHQRALQAAHALVDAGVYSGLNERTFDTRDQFRERLFSDQKPALADPAARTHTSSPFVWLGDGRFVGGCDALLDIAATHELAPPTSTPPTMAAPTAPYFSPADQPSDWNHLDGFRADIRAAMEAVYTHVTTGGTWLSSAQRREAAMEARRVYNSPHFDSSAAFDPAAVDGSSCGSLPRALVTLIHQVCQKPGDIGHELSILNYIGRKTALGGSSRGAVKPYFCTSLPLYLMRRICQSPLKEDASQPA